MTFVFAASRQLSSTGTWVDSSRTWSRCRSAWGELRDIRQHGRDCRSCRWAAKEPPPCLPQIQPVCCRRSRRRRCAAATRRSPGSRRTAATIGRRELWATARKRLLLKLKRKAGWFELVTWRSRRLARGKRMQERETNSQSSNITESHIPSLRVHMVGSANGRTGKLTDCSLPEGFRALLGHDLPCGVDDASVGRLTRPSDDLQARFYDVGRRHQGRSGNTGDGTSGEQRQRMIVTARQVDVQMRFL